MSVINRVIILGHSGFIGSRLEKILTEKKLWEITGKSLPDIDLTDPESTDQLLPYLTEDSALILMAAVKRQFGDTLEAFRKNITIVENVCHLLETHPVKRIIFMSSAAVYGEETENTNISENSSLNPTSYYGIAKYTAERLLMKTCESNQISSLVCLRPPLVYGPDDPGKTYGPSGFVSAAIEGSPITLWGDGTELREFIYIDDLCHVIENMIQNEFEGEVNVVSGKSYTFADVITVLKAEFPDLVVTSRPRSKQKADNAFNAERIRKILPTDFKFTGLETGLSRLLQ